MSIYTKRGDWGKTSLYKTSRRASKDSPRIASVGSLDELDAVLGLAASLLGKKAEVISTKENLVKIQQDLFEIAAELATPKAKDSPFVCSGEKTRRLETLIDSLERKLPVLSGFIFPGGVPSGAALHLARSVCRRAEREVVAFSRSSYINPEILKYLNRLSDALFMLAREVNRLEKSPEIKKSGKSG